MTIPATIEDLMRDHRAVCVIGGSSMRDGFRRHGFVTSILGDDLIVLASAEDRTRYPDQFIRLVPGRGDVVQSEASQDFLRRWRLYLIHVVKYEDPALIHPALLPATCGPNGWRELRDAWVGAP